MSMKYIADVKNFRYPVLIYVNDALEEKKKLIKPLLQDKYSNVFYLAT